MTTTGSVFTPTGAIFEMEMEPSSPLLQHQSCLDYVNVHLSSQERNEWLRRLDEERRERRERAIHIAQQERQYTYNSRRALFNN